MKQSNLFFKSAIAFCALCLVIISCEKDKSEPSGEARDETVTIDDNSAFNMKNFIASFNQIFVADNRWAWDFSHDYDDGLAKTSYQNYKVYGKIGEKIFTITHNFNADNVITSSVRNTSEFESDTITFTYEYNTEGFITKLTKKDDGEILDIVSLEYNGDNQLVKKIHLALEVGDDEWEEVFTYHSDGTVSTYENEKWGEKYEYEYSDGKMVKSSEYEDGVLDDVENYEYDSEGRIVEISDDDGWKIEIEYASDKATVYEYEDNILDYKGEYEAGLKEVKSFNYVYDNAVFIYCRAIEIGDDGKVKQKYYYEGSVDNLQLVGYTIVDSRDPVSKRKTKESVYDASDNKLYYAEFTVTDGSITETNWFSADGTAISESDISEFWVFILIR